MRHRPAVGGDVHTAAEGTGRGRQRLTVTRTGLPGRPTGTSTSRGRARSSGLVAAGVLIVNGRLDTADVLLSAA